MSDREKISLAEARKKAHMPLAEARFEQMLEASLVVRLRLLIVDVALGN